MKNIKLLRKMYAATFALSVALSATAQVQQDVILQEGFENGIPSTWTTIDADGDKNVWYITMPEGSNPHSGSFCATSASWLGKAVTPDNWLITPRLDLRGAGKLTFFVCSQDSKDIAEHYAVYASTTGNNTDDFTVKLHEETLTMENNKGNYKEVSLSLPAGTRYVAFRHFGCSDQFRINIDDVSITAETADNAVIIDGTTKPILSAKLFAYGDGDFNLYLYLSDDRNESVVIEGNESIHVGRTVDLTITEPRHTEFYWSIAYFSDYRENQRLFTPSGEGGNYGLFDTGTMSIKGRLDGDYTLHVDNAKITDSKYGDGKPHTFSLNFTGGTTGITNMAVIPAGRPTGVYTLDGRYLGHETDRLPQGIYIVNGKKVVK
ncbi:MAG: choice-of-anchor J domain-containing protein [Prevotellaceae bacterium]|nr:choice-of-anchor J domain-containing protein [Prevotella sp.]MDD7530621.1 choice-of-anchor J domain-containing protein [Prevotellaceae bacterium]